MMASWWFNNFDDFNEVLDIFDFPLEDVEENPGEEQLEAPPWDVLNSFMNDCSNVPADAPGFQNSSTILHEESSLTKPVLSDAKPILGETIVKSSGIADGKFVPVFQTTSPVSVLESSNAPSAENRASLDLKVAFVKRPRTKRERPESLKLKLERPESLKFAPGMSYTSAAKKNQSESDVLKEPKDHLKDHLRQRCNQTRQKENNLSPHSNAIKGEKIHFWQPFGTRKCTHCQSTSTPQWREGPQGPKTLCNACGVRYRSGRLYPEYRPAGSPTFVPSLHSNSHKKVMELRTMGKQAAKTHRFTSP